jgi:hypothetical protein
MYQIFLEIAADLPYNSASEACPALAFSCFLRYDKSSIESKRSARDCRNRMRHLRIGYNPHRIARSAAERNCLHNR